MRRLRLVGVVTVLPLLLGCGGLRDAFSPRAEVAARANDEQLSVERLGVLAGTGKSVPLEPAMISRLARVWTDYMLFAQAITAGENLRDSATALAAMWPLVSQLKWERFHEQAVAQAAEFSPAQLDSAYQAGDVRLFQHILFQVPANSTAEVDAQKKRQADQVWPRARAAGAGFGRLARQYSEDPGSRVQGGMLGVFGRGQFVLAFEDAAWQLGPGEVSPVIKSPFGYHIIRRPPLAEVSDTFRTGVEERALFLADSLYIDSLTTRRKIEPVGNAPEIMRAAALDIDAARTSNRAVVKYRGGSFKVRDVVRWLSALDPSVLQALPQASDEQVNQFLKAIVQRQLLIAQADSAGITLSPDEMAMVRAQHDSVITIVATVLDLNGAMTGDSTGSPRAKVEDYLERVLSGRARFYPLPSFLGETLRDRAEWAINPAGVRRAVERAREIRAVSDSLRPPGQAPDTGGGRR